MRSIVLAEACDSASRTWKVDAASGRVQASDRTTHAVTASVLQRSQSGIVHGQNRGPEIHLTLLCCVHIDPKIREEEL